MGVKNLLIAERITPLKVSLTDLMLVAPPSCKYANKPPPSREPKESSRNI